MTETALKIGNATPTAIDYDNFVKWLIATANMGLIPPNATTAADHFIAAWKQGLVSIAYAKP